ncbi:Uncharacterised protein [uncultured archaeon]|nr:Uncharacterised protein [uncultured archaeon]
MSDINKIYETEFKKAYDQKDFKKIFFLSIEHPELKRYLTQEEAIKMLTVYEALIVEAAAMNVMFSGKPLVVELKADKDITQKINESMKDVIIN